MKRRAFLVLVTLAAAARSVAQDDATRLQIDLALAHASLAAVRARFGDAHDEAVRARGRVQTLRASLELALTRGAVIDPSAVGRALDAELADVRARLGELSSRCGAGRPDLQSAHAREAALVDALAHVTSEGVFLPR